MKKLTQKNLEEILHKFKNSDIANYIKQNPLVVASFRIEEHYLDLARDQNLNISKICRDAIIKKIK